MTARKIVVTATQIIGVYMVLTAIPTLIGALFFGCIGAADADMAEEAFRAALMGAAAPFIQLVVGLWACYSARLIVRALIKSDDEL